MTIAHENFCEDDDDPGVYTETKLPGNLHRDAELRPFSIRGIHDGKMTDANEYRMISDSSNETLREVAWCLLRGEDISRGVEGNKQSLDSSGATGVRTVDTPEW